MTVLAATLLACSSLSVHQPENLRDVYVLVGYTCHSLVPSMA